MLNFKLFSPYGLIKEDNVTHVQVSSNNLGSFGVLTGHAPVISAIKEGYLEVDKENETYFVSILGGIFKLQNNEIICTTEDAVIGATLEDANNLLKKNIENRKNQNRERNIELALAEDELKKQIKKIGAGHL